MTTPEDFARRAAAESLAGGDPTGWFERVYAAAQTGQAVVPWDHGLANPLLESWAHASGLEGSGRRAVVVGCGLGEDAELIAGYGFDTTGFDISPTATQAARRRFPGSPVRYVTADLLDLPADWREHFDLVVETMTLQALPDPPRAAAIASVGQLVAPGGRLLVIARAGEPGDPVNGPPWTLTRAEIDGLADTGLSAVRIEDILDDPMPRRWRAEFARPTACR